MATEKPIRMRKDINLLSACSIMTGVIIGSGIFVSPVSFVINSRSVGMALLMWGFSGLLTLCVALCFVELAGIFPRAGGEYAFFRESYGPLPAFVCVWHHYVMVQPSFQAVLALTTTDYLMQAIFADHCNLPDSARILFTIWILVTIVALNSVYVKYVSCVQIVFAFVKIFAVIGIIITGLYQLAKGKTDILSQGFRGTSPSLGAHATSVYSGIFTYMGWQYIFTLIEEVKHPERTVPRATVISMLTVTVLYVLTNVAYFTVMAPEEMMASKAVVLTFAEKTIGKYSKIVPLLVACSTVGSLNGAILGGSRYYYAAARDNLFPSLMSAIHIKYLTPWLSLFSVTIFAIIYIVTGEAIVLLEYLGFSSAVMLFLGVVVLLYIRWKKASLTRSIKIPIVIPITCFFTLGGLLFLGVYHSPYKNGIAVLLMTTAVPVYYIALVWASKKEKYRAKMGKWNAFLQKCFLILPPDKDD